MVKQLKRRSMMIDDAACATLIAVAITIKKMLVLPCAIAAVGGLSKSS